MSTQIGNLLRGFATVLVFFLASLATAQEDVTRLRHVYRLGSMIAAPFVIAKSHPVYTSEALLAKLEGSVLLSLVVDSHGLPRDICVEHSLGFGLDQSAIESVQRWKFAPGTKSGVAVDVRVNEEVFFHTRRDLWDWHVVRVVFARSDRLSRPVLTRTKFPKTLDEEENASVTVAFDVEPNGRPSHAVVVKSSDGKWDPQLLAALRDWRFLPGEQNGRPAVVETWLEFVRGSHSPIPHAALPLGAAGKVSAR